MPMTLSEQWTLLEDPTLGEKCSASALLSAKTIMLELASVTNHANRLIWAAATFENPVSAGNKMRRAVVSWYAATKTLAQMASITDAEIQSVVDGAVNVFATGS